MNNIKKAGIITGAVVGGVIGGTISVIGKVTKKKFIDELGESVVDSTILTGGIAGDIASGTANVISGKIQHQQDKLEEGKTELKSAGSQVVQNFVNNVKTVVDNSGEILEGVKEKDGKKILRGTRTLAKVAVVGALTVGTIKIKPEDEASKADNTRSASLRRKKHQQRIQNKSRTAMCRNACCPFIFSVLIYRLFFTASDLFHANLGSGL
ncbi:MAG: hypothetical protein K0R19_875 [Bacillota bacterium]|nr:hypothetical protein [Bacillota bacterium]